MANSLLAILKQEFSSALQYSKRKHREVEIELHPERKCWDERLWKLEDYTKDLNNFVLSFASAPILSVMTSLAYQFELRDVGNILGLGTIMMTCSLWYSYRKLRKSPFYR
jgi:hypothetical protein